MDHIPARWRFDDIYWSILTVFQVISGDDWWAVMTDATSTVGTGALFYFLCIVIFGNFILFNFAFAILLANMDDNVNEEKKLLDQVEVMAEEMADDPDMTQDEKMTVLRDELRGFRERVVEREAREFYEQGRGSNWDPWPGNLQGKSMTYFLPHDPTRIKIHQLATSKRFLNFIDMCIVLSSILLALEDATMKEGSTKQVLIEISDIVLTLIFWGEMMIKVIAHGFYVSPCDIPRKWTPITSQDELDKHTERCLQQVNRMRTLEDQDKDEGSAFHAPTIQHVWKGTRSNDDYVLLHYLSSLNQEARILFKVNVKDSGQEGYDVQAIYRLTLPERKCKQHHVSLWPWKLFEPQGGGGYSPPTEWDLKQICTSLYMNMDNTNSYLSDSWNVMDGSIVAASAFAMIFPNIPAFKVVRAFRPLRLALRFDGIKVVLTTLGSAVLPTIGALTFTLFVFYVLAIIGLATFMGSFRSCKDSDGNTLYEVTQAECTERALNGEGTSWVNYPLNFDNIGNAMVSLFILSTAKWSDCMYVAVDSSAGINNPPSLHGRDFTALYFILVYMIAGTVTLSLVVSVLVDEFNRARTHKEGSAFRTEEQEHWVQIQRLLERFKLNDKKDKPHNKYRADIFEFVSHKYFDWFIMTIIVFNTITMATRHYDQGQAYSNFLDVCNGIFLFIFTAEAVLKITGFGWFEYWAEDWNKFDFLVVLVAYMGKLPFMKVDASMIRIVRIGRALRLIRKARQLNLLFKTLVYALPSIGNIGSFLIVVFFFYAVIGVRLFGTLPLDGEIITEQWNFKSFFNAFFFLYVISSDDYSAIYRKVVTASDGPNGNGSILTAVFFVTFFIIGSLVMLNLFIGAILDIYTENLEDEERADELVSIHAFRRRWSDLDPYGKGYLSVEQFVDVLMQCPYPVGFAPPMKNDVQQYKWHLAEQELLMRMKTIMYKERTATILLRLKVSEIKKLTHSQRKEFDRLSDKMDRKQSVIIRDPTQYFEDDEVLWRLKKMPGYVRHKRDIEGFSEGRVSDGLCHYVLYDEMIVALCCSIIDLDIMDASFKSDMSVADWWATKCRSKRQQMENDKKPDAERRFSADENLGTTKISDKASRMPRRNQSVPNIYSGTSKLPNRPFE